MQIHPVGAELFHADIRTDRQTDTTKLITAFRNYAKLQFQGSSLECDVLQYLIYVNNNV